MIDSQNVCYKTSLLLKALKHRFKLSLAITFHIIFSLDSLDAFFQVYKFDQNIFIRKHDVVSSSKYKIIYITGQACE